MQGLKVRESCCLHENHWQTKDRSFAHYSGRLGHAIPLLVSGFRNEPALILTIPCRPKVTPRKQSKSLARRFIAFEFGLILDVEGGPCLEAPVEDVRGLEHFLSLRRNYLGVYVLAVTSGAYHDDEDM